MWIQISGALGAAAVILGAFGAHALRGRLGPDQLANWHTAVNYHLVHTVVLLGLALWANQSGRSINLTASLFTAGIVLFSGSIYLLVTVKASFLGPITPLGGLCFIAGWLSLIWLKLS